MLSCIFSELGSIPLYVSIISSTCDSQKYLLDSGQSYSHYKPLTSRYYLVSFKVMLNRYPDRDGNSTVELTNLEFIVDYSKPCIFESSQYRLDYLRCVAKEEKRFEYLPINCFSQR